MSDESLARNEPSTPAIGHVLFVSSTTGGGSGRSQRELARRLRDEGVAVTLLVDDGAGLALRRRVDERLLDASVRFRDTAGGRLAGRLRPTVVGPARAAVIDGLLHHLSAAPETAITAALAGRPDIVVGSSISRPTWQRVTKAARAAAVPTALYLREATALEHLTTTTPDVLLANSASLADQAAARGHRAHVVPSVVTVAEPERPTTGEVALLVNPIETHGVGRVAAIAAARPDIPFVLQESWPLDRPRRRVVDDLATRYDNVTVRPRVDDTRALFADARLLLVPHEIDNRPRTVLEAQVHGVAVVAADQPGLRELIGETGVLLPRGAADDAWVDTVGGLWDDDVRRRRLVAAARVFASRDEVQPLHVVRRFLETIASVVPVLAPTPAAGGER